MNARRVISLLTVSLAMGLGGLGVAAWYTETGSALLVTRLVGLVPELSVGVLRGTLSSQMLADTLAYTSPAVTVTSTKGKFRLSLADLLRGRVLSPGIELQGVHVIYRGNTATAPGSASVNIPIPIMLRAVDITDAVVTINDLDPVRVSYALADIQLGGETLQLDVGHFDIGSADFSGELRFQLNAPYDYSATIDTLQTAALPGLPEWSVTASVLGSNQEVKVTSRVLTPNAVDIVASGGFDDGFTLSLQATADELALANVALHDTKVDLMGSLDALRIEASTALSHDTTGTLDARMSGTRSRDGILIHDLQVAGQQGEVKASGELKLNAPGNMLALTFEGLLHGRALRGTTRLTGPGLDELNGTLQVAQAENTLSVSADQGQLEASANLTDLSSLFTGFGGSLNATASMRLPGGPFQLHGEGTPKYGEWTMGRTRFSVEGPTLEEVGGSLDVGALAFKGDAMGAVEAGWVGGLAIANLDVNWQHPTIQTDLSGKVTIAGKTIDIDVNQARLSYQQLTWQLVESVRARVTDGRVSATDLCWARQQDTLCVEQFSAAAEGGNATLTGTIEASGIRVEGLAGTLGWRQQDGTNYRGELTSSKVLVPGVDAFRQVSMTLQGDLESLNFSASSDLDSPFLPALISLQGVATASEIDGSVLLTSPRGRLETAVRYETDGRRLTLRLEGDIEQRQMEGTADFSLDGPWVTGAADIRLADSARLMANANSDGMLTASFEADDIGRLLPSVGGPVSVTGNMDQTDLRYELLARSAKLSYGALSLGDLVLRGQGNGIHTALANLKVDRIARNGEPFGKVDIEFEKQQAASILALAYVSEWLSLNVQGDAQLDSDGARGQITIGEMTVGTQNWSLEAPVPFQVSTAGSSIAPHCWRIPSSAFCIASARFDDQGSEFEAELSAAPISFQELAFAPDVDLKAILTARASFRSDHVSGGAGHRHGAIHFDLPRAEIRYFGDDTMNWAVSGQLDLTGNVLTGTLTGDVDPLNHFSLRGRLPDVNDLARYQISADLATDQLGVVTAFVPQLDRAHGNIEASASMDTSGPSSTARLSMTVGQNASVAVPAAGVVLEGLVMTATGNAERIEITFDARSGTGALSGNGFIVEPMSSERQLDIALKADQFTAIKRPELSVVASANATFRYQGAGTAQLAGKVTVNSGAFSLGGLDPAIVRQTSRDVVVVSRHTEAPLLGELDLNLAIDVETFSLDLFGLDGNLRGTVALTQRPGNPRTTVGTLNLIDGTFSRYGQSFEVERGRLIFAGPFANPTVDVIATREIKETGRIVSVSLLLSGPANNIRSTITSSPAMSEAQALSYLMLGRSLVGANAAQGQTLTGAAVALGLRQASPITDEIRSALGLTELTIETGVDSTTVVAGRQLNPMLYVQYSYDVLGRIGGILFSYQLTDRLSLETKTGEENSAQIIYTF